MTTLLDLHDGLLIDLDGTLYRGSEVVPGAVEALAVATAAGFPVRYVTNNASRGPAEVAEHLRGLGFPVEDGEVVTSAQAGARMLADRLPIGAAVYVVGTAALVAEITAVGLSSADCCEDAVAVVQGHSPETCWAELAQACLAIRADALWVATNVDVTLPTERGLLPGNGAMVAALRAATDREPLVAGKPAAPLIEMAVRQLGARAPLVIGDRLDTDIEGARAAGLPSLLVLTGVADAAGLLAAPAEQRPDYIGLGLDALHADAEAIRPGTRSGWHVRVDDDGVLVLEAEPEAGPSPGNGPGDGPGTASADALRALCGTHWAAGGGPARVRANGPAPTQALKRLGLTAAADESATVTTAG